MPRSPLALAAALVLGAGALALHARPDSPAAAPAHREVASASPVEDHATERLPPPTTTTVPPTTTTPIAPPAPPPPAPPPPAPRRVVAASAHPPAPAPLPAAADNSAARALQLLNGERVRAGLSPLGTMAPEASVAQAWSSSMAGAGMSHNPDLAGDLERVGVVGWRSLGENVGYGSSVDQVHSMFMASGTHRATILSGSYSEVGIGVVESGGVVWITMDFVGW